MPKLLGMMASAKPSLVTGNLESEVAKVFAKSKGGYFFDSTAFDTVVEAIHSMIYDKIASEKMGASSRAYIIEHFSATEVLKSFAHQVEKILAHTKETNG
jgi:colanic acid biosynthesis glycosyl transferase WcaI